MACADRDTSSEPVTDTAPPLVRELTVSRVDDSTAVVEGRVTDDVAVTAIEWWISNPTVHAPAPITTGPDARFRVVLPVRPSGAIEAVRIQAFDAKGNVVDTTVSYLFGPHRPTVSVAGLPPAATPIRGRGIALFATILANYPNASVDSLIVTVDPGTAAERRIANGQVNGPGQITVPILAPGPFVNGPHTVVVRTVASVAAISLNAALASGYAASSDTTFTVTTQVDDVPYAVTVIEAPSGGGTQAVDLNARGDVLGYELGVQPFRWFGGRTIPLSTPPGISTSVTAMDDSDEVVGYLSRPDCVVAVWWSAEGVRSPILGSTEGCGEAPWARPLAINERHQVLLDALVDDVPAVLDVRAPAAAAFRSPANVGLVGLNNRGVVTGLVTSDGLRSSIGAIWSPTLTSFNCPSFGPLLTVFGREQCVLGEINDAGDAVGNVSGHPFIRRGSGELLSLTPALLTIPAVSINARSQVLAFDSAAATAFVWTNGAVSSVRPSTAAWRLTNVVRINDVGQIAANATNTASGAKRAVLLTP